MCDFDMLCLFTVLTLDLVSFHNYRYLWPLIHYHKFLAKCIKKLKRNGVDVKVSVSPVAVFLREEVCAVSDHLAAVSLFQSEQWMECLQDFEGWSNAVEEARLRVLIGNLSLRPLEEPGDVESPLLRDQIDEQFLRAMVAARESMTSEPKTKPPKAPKSGETENTTQSTRHGLPLHPQSVRLLSAFLISWGTILLCTLLTLALSGTTQTACFNEC